MLKPPPLSLEPGEELLYRAARQPIWPAALFTCASLFLLLGPHVLRENWWYAALVVLFFGVLAIAQRRAYLVLTSHSVRYAPLRIPSREQKLAWSEVEAIESRYSLFGLGSILNSLVLRPRSGAPLVLRGVRDCEALAAKLRPLLPEDAATHDIENLRRPSLLVRLVDRSFWGALALGYAAFTLQALLPLSLHRATAHAEDRYLHLRPLLEVVELRQHPDALWAPLWDDSTNQAIAPLLATERAHQVGGSDWFVAALMRPPLPTVQQISLRRAVQYADSMGAFFEPIRATSLQFRTYEEVAPRSFWDLPALGVERDSLIMEAWTVRAFSFHMAGQADSARKSLEGALQYGLALFLRTSHGPANELGYRRSLMAAERLAAYEEFRGNAEQSRMIREALRRGEEEKPSLVPQYPWRGRILYRELPRVLRSTALPDGVKWEWVAYAQFLDACAALPWAPTPDGWRKDLSVFASKSERDPVARAALRQPELGECLPVLWKRLGHSPPFSS